jgi:hypothetical protein
MGPRYRKSTNRAAPIPAPQSFPRRSISPAITCTCSRYFPGPSCSNDRKSPAFDTSKAEASMLPVVTEASR